MGDSMGTFLVDYERDDTARENAPVITQASVQTARAAAKGPGNLHLSDTREVINTTEITPLPNTPSFIKGIIDLRGIITTIIDLKEMMHITQEADGKKKARIIVLDASVSAKMIGVLVDDVLAVSTYTHEEIDRDTHASQKSDRDILGIIRKKTKTSDREKNDLIIWLDIRTMIRRVEQDL